MESIELESLVGEVLTYIDVDEEESEIMLTTKSGRQIMIHHNQECCECVSMEDTQGNWHDLIGKVLLVAEDEQSNEGEPPYECDESWMLTTLTFKVDDATVISRWFGSSNGYYSESVSIEEIADSR